jgi:hypothetical protein
MLHLLFIDCFAVGYNETAFEKCQAMKQYL